MPIPGQIIWSLIYRNFEAIPVVIINQTSTLGEVYLEFAKQAMEFATVEGYEFMNGSDRYFIPAKLFKTIAEENNYNVSELKNTFDMPCKAKRNSYWKRKRRRRGMTRLDDSKGRTPNVS